MVATKKVGGIAVNDCFVAHTIVTRQLPRVGMSLSLPCLPFERPVLPQSPLVYSRVNLLTGCTCLVTPLQIDRLTGQKRRCPTAEDREAKRARVAQLKQAVQAKEAALASRKQLKVGLNVVTAPLPSVLHQRCSRPRTAAKGFVLCGCTGRQKAPWRKVCNLKSLDSMRTEEEIEEGKYVDLGWWEG